jgi:hypothetical protein
MPTQEPIPPVVSEVAIFWFIQELGEVPKLIYDTWDEMRPNVQRVMFEYGEREAGLRRDPMYPEEALEV